MAPTQTAGNGRTQAGRFAKGNPGGPGRPRGLDFRAIVADHAEATGTSVEDTILDVFHSLVRQAREGDVQAAKFLIERLCGKDDSAEPDEPMRQMSDIERASRIQAILDSAARRRAKEAEGLASTAAGDDAEALK